MNAFASPDASINEPSPGAEVRLFTEKAAAVAAGIGGPLAGAYLIAKNFRSLGKPKAARLTLIVGVAITLAVCALVFLPDSAIDRIPREAIPFIYGTIGYVAVKHLQQTEIDAHLKAGGRKGSWLTIVGVGLVSLVLTLSCLYLFTFLGPESRAFEGAPYRLESTGCTLYYDQANIPETDAQFVGALLEEMGYFSKESKLPAGFRKDGSKYVIEMLLDKEKWEDDLYQQDLSHALGVLRRWHQDCEFQIQLVSIDLIGQRHIKVVE